MRSSTMFQPATLGGSQLLVDDDGTGLDAARCQLSSRALPDPVGRRRLHAALDVMPGPGHANRRFPRARQLAQRVFGPFFALGGAQSHEDGLFGVAPGGIRPRKCPRGRRAIRADAARACSCPRSRLQRPRVVPPSGGEPFPSARGCGATTSLDALVANSSTEASIGGRVHIRPSRGDPVSHGGPSAPRAGNDRLSSVDEQYFTDSCPSRATRPRHRCGDARLFDSSMRVSRASFRVLS